MEASPSIVVVSRKTLKIKKIGDADQVLKTGTLRARGEDTVLRAIQCGIPMHILMHNHESAAAAVAVEARCILRICALSQLVVCSSRRDVVVFRRRQDTPKINSAHTIRTIMFT